MFTKFAIDEIRLSWATSVEEFRSFLENRLEIAREKGRIIYDGQVQKEVTWENIDEVVAFFASAAGDFI